MPKHLLRLRKVEELTDRWKKQELKDYLKAVLSNVIALQDAHNGEIEELIFAHDGEIEELMFAHDGEIEAMDEMLEAYLLQIRSLKQDSLLLDKQLGILVDSIITLHDDYLQIGILRDSLENSMTLLVSANQTISLLSDSLALKDSLLKTLYDVGRVTSNDYLNQYAKTGVIPEEETILTLELHRIMLMHGFTPNHDGNVMFNYKENSIDFGYGPELLSPNDITLSKISYITSMGYQNWSDVLEKRRSMSWTSFNSFFPKLELTKGTLLRFVGGIMNQNNVTDFIVKSSKSYNAGKRQYHWKLTEGEQSSVNDLTLDIYEVEGEFYLAIDMSQLMRFDFWVISPSYGLIRPSKERQSYHSLYRNYDNTIFSQNSDLYDDFTYWQENQEITIPSKPSVLFFRKNPDASNTLANTMIEPMNMIFLFKLKEE